MHILCVPICLVLVASAVSAAPYTSPYSQATGAQNVIYWGQNGGGTIENNDLSTYCTSDSGIDIIVLAFLYEFGNGNTIPSGTIGQSCFISTSGHGQDCEAVANSIATCQAAGVKIILSLGGASGSYSLQSTTGAETIGQYLWESYGNPANTSAVQRPFGSIFVNGFDFDIETKSGSQYYPYMIAILRANFATDPLNTYYITGAPQCPLPEPNMGAMIGNSTFDYLWPQFYNNNNYIYPCALPFHGNAAFNYDQWVEFTADTPSNNAEIFIGVPAAPDAANGAPSGETYYITPIQLAELVAVYKTHDRFGGIMMWSAGFSDSNVLDGCTFAQEAHAILETGLPCMGSGVGSSGNATTNLTETRTATRMATFSTTVPTATGVGTVSPQWAQCGGEGYSGPSICMPPYTCVKTSAWWAQCE